MKIHEKYTEISKDIIPSIVLDRLSIKLPKMEMALISGETIYTFGFVRITASSVCSYSFPKAGYDKMQNIFTVVSSDCSGISSRFQFGFLSLAITSFLTPLTKALNLSWGCLNRFYRALTSPSSPAVVQNI